MYYRKFWQCRAYSFSHCRGFWCWSLSTVVTKSLTPHHVYLTFQWVMFFLKWWGNDVEVAWLQINKSVRGKPTAGTKLLNVVTKICFYCKNAGSLEARIPPQRKTLLRKVCPCLYAERWQSSKIMRVEIKGDKLRSDKGQNYFRN